jgi:hypothetical protein
MWPGAHSKASIVFGLATKPVLNVVPCSSKPLLIAEESGSRGEVAHPADRDDAAADPSVHRRDRDDGPRHCIARLSFATWDSRSVRLDAQIDLDRK